MAPPKAAVATAKKQRLTLSQLAAYDDILTDALVDHAFYWATVPKNRSSYHPSRGIREEEIAKIIQEEVVVNKDLEAAEKRLLASDGLKRFVNGLKSDKEKADFVQHLRRYLRIYAPDCPWEVSTTNRYTIVTHEACVIARRYIKRNETIKYLSGIQINITPEEEKEITVRKKDFSIVVSSRKKCTSLFMGPARFANHDCRANAKLMTTSHSTIEIVASRPIDVGEEITVTYSDCYFGEDNCECLCRTCEQELRNGWAPEDGAATVKISVEDDEPKETYSLRRRRRDDSIGGSSRTPSVTPDMRPRIYKTKLKAKKRDAQETSAIPSPAPEETPRGRKRTVEAIATPPITPAKKMKLLSASSDVSANSLSLPGAASSVDDSASTRSATPSHTDAPETDITTPEKESPEPDAHTPRIPSAQPLDNTNEKQAYQDAASTAVEPVSPQSMGSRASPDMPRTEAPVRTVPRPPQLITMSISSILNDPSPTEDTAAAYYPFTTNIGVAREPVVESKFVLISEPDDVRPEEVEEDEEEEDVQPEIEVKTEIHVETRIEAETEAEAEPTMEAAASDAKSKRRKRQKSISEQSAPPPARVRTPGDYVLTPLLLSEPDMAWIQCTNCSDYFVQQNAYFTRSCCPRCERHSKLYGYAWPKTDKAGPSDKEERILDHRMIHRFLDSNDERRARGRKLVSESRDDTEDLDAERGRSSRREFTRAGNRSLKDDDSRVRRSGRTRQMSSRLAEW
ncbi:histone-lysine n-methyltransferase set9 [Trichoderma arundinaceum]|uniref:Histone-lysine N-methyltransferase SET9 n=1 Tax=Trichoderma arundinaceum TaxID=490622 RepID=A0A395NI07_TRIAR|nr:histone-lysine n-methyltransferase set9 [Trichoderma arundinaceum]